MLNSTLDRLNNPHVLDPRARAAERQKKRPKGPLTPDGKSLIKHLSTRYGLAAKDMLIPGEDRLDYYNLYAALVEEHQPRTITENLLLEQICDAAWRLRRLDRIEAGLFELEWETRLEYGTVTVNTPQTDACKNAYILARPENLRLAAELSRQYGRTKRIFDTSIRRLKELQKERTDAEHAERQRLKNLRDGADPASFPPKPDPVPRPNRDEHLLAHLRRPVRPKKRPKPEPIKVTWVDPKEDDAEDAA